MKVLISEQNDGINAIRRPPELQSADPLGAAGAGCGRPYEIVRALSTTAVLDRRLPLPARRDLPDAFAGVAGTFYFNPADAARCRLQVRLGEHVRFESWRARQVGPRSYWMAGALSVRQTTRLATILIDGPSEETRDVHGDWRARLTAVLRLTLPELQNLPSASIRNEIPVHLSMELVSTMPAEIKALVA